MELFFWLNTMANLTQLESYELLLSDFNNKDIVVYLKENKKVLKRIVEQNNEIIKLLKEQKDGH